MPPFPLGLACVAANLDGSRHEVRVWDAMFADDPEASLWGCVRDFGPDAIGLSVRNVDDQEIRAPRFFLPETRQLVAACREVSAAPVVAGGPGFSIFATRALTYLGADYGIVGEGERAFPLLLDHLAARRRPADVPGLVWRKDGRVRATRPDWIEPLDRLAPPDRVRTDAQRYYATPGTGGIPNTATVQAKRGCPFSCVYCSTPAIEGRQVRVRSPRAVVDEVEQLVARGFRRIHFTDSLFTNPEWHAEAICSELLRRGLGIQWSCTINPRCAPPDLLRLMQRAGCELVMVGNESGCTRVLDGLKKGFAKADVERCFVACESLGLRYHAFLLIGGPGEDRESVEESIELLERFTPAHVSVTVGVRLYPGCELSEMAKRSGMISRRANLLMPAFYMPPAIGDWVWERLAAVMAQRPEWGF